MYGKLKKILLSSSKYVYYNFIVKVQDKYLQKKIMKEFDEKSLTWGLNKERREQKIIVSLTTIPSRLEKTVYVIDQLLKQTVKPDKLILYVGKTEESILYPKEFQYLLKRGLEVKIVKDVGPSTKFFYSMQEYFNDLIVTVDDDILYPETLIEGLINTYIKFPHSVIAYRVHQMKINKQGRITPYNNWNWEAKSFFYPSESIIATGVGGVLYPPSTRPIELFNLENLKRLSFRADDIWLKGIQMLNNIPIVQVEGYDYRLIHADGTQNITLSSSNVGEATNDLYFRQMIDYYGLEEKIKKIL